MTDKKSIAPPPLWVFGYGSLIWNPEFPVAERRIARLAGYGRRFCMWSVHHRGTAQAPGLVLALDAHPGASCAGVALRVAPGAEDETLANLRARELVSSAYLERRLDVAFSAGGGAEAVAFVVDRAHEQYCGALSLEAQAEVIARASGGRGANCNYLWSTAEHLAALGIADPEIEWLARRVRALRGG